MITNRKNSEKLKSVESPTRHRTIISKLKVQGFLTATNRSKVHEKPTNL